MRFKGTNHILDLSRPSVCPSDSNKVLDASRSHPLW